MKPKVTKLTDEQTIAVMEVLSEVEHRREYKPRFKTYSLNAQELPVFKNLGTYIDVNGMILKIERKKLEVKIIKMPDREPPVEENEEPELEEAGEPELEEAKEPELEEAKEPEEAEETAFEDDEVPAKKDETPEIDEATAKEAEAKKAKEAKAKEAEAKAKEAELKKKKAEAKKAKEKKAEEKKAEEKKIPPKREEPLSDDDPLILKTGDDFLIWIGYHYYPKIADYINEVLEHGFLKKVRRIPEGLETGDTKIFIAHNEGFDGLGVIIGYCLPEIKKGEIGDYPKRRDGQDMSDINSQYLVGVFKPAKQFINIKGEKKTKKFLPVNGQEILTSKSRTSSPSSRVKVPKNAKMRSPRSAWTDKDREELAKFIKKNIDNPNKFREFSAATGRSVRSAEYQWFGPIKKAAEAEAKKAKAEKG